jgi:hypothetical protein
MKKVLMIIAPMGFGPASKGLYIAEKLSLFTDLTITSMGDACDFVAKFAPANVTCKCGGITSLFTLGQIKRFDMIISINNVPAVMLLTKLGLGKRVILLDSLLHWRQEKTNMRLHQPLLAYLVQDFPGVSQCNPLYQAQYSRIVAPMIWSSNRTLAQKRARQGITMCFGGITSTLVHWDDIKVLIKTLIMSAYETCKILDIPLTVIGNDRLREFDISDEDSLKILGMVNPLVSYELIANSQLLITTPGIGTVYEGVGASTPIMLMPPTNSTQLQQHQVFVDAGFFHILEGCSTLQQLYDIKDFPWEQQAALCVDWLQHRIDELPTWLNQSIVAICDESGKFKTEEILKQQNNLFDNLNQSDINEILHQLINLSP